MIGISPFAGRGIDPVVVDTMADFLTICFEFLRPAGKIFVNAGFGKRIFDGYHHGGVFAGRVLGFVIFGFYVNAVFPDRQDGFFPGLGQALSGNM